MELVKEYNLDKSELHLLGKSDYVMDSLSSRKIHNLNETVKLMVAAGYKKECYDVYSSWRKVFLKVCLNSSGTVKNHPGLNLMLHFIACTSGF